MAAVSYRCPVDPDNCPTHAEPGYCQRHHAPLERVRLPLRRPDEPPAASPAAAPTADPTCGVPGRRAASVPVRWSVRVLGRDLAVPTQGALVVGREEGPFASLPGMAEQLYVSRRRHAQLYRVGDTLRLVDLGSTNGTFLDGVPVTGELMARDGQPVSFGRPPGGLTAVVVRTLVQFDGNGLPL